MINKGYKHGFISNSDNLGALMDEAVLGYFATHNFPFMMEVADRTEADPKGGHLARLKAGGLALWSDCYVLTEDSRIVENPGRRPGAIRIELDDGYYKRIDQLKERLPYHCPSLIDCRSLRIEGNVSFGRDVVIRGDVDIVSHPSKKVSIPDGTVINADLLLD